MFQHVDHYLRTFYCSTNFDLYNFLQCSTSTTFYFTCTTTCYCTFFWLYIWILRILIYQPVFCIYFWHFQHVDQFCVRFTCTQPVSVRIIYFLCVCVEKYMFKHKLCMSRKINTYLWIIVFLQEFSLLYNFEALDLISLFMHANNKINNIFLT